MSNLVGKKVLEIYQKNNPSDSYNFKKTLKIRNDIISRKLNFPLRFFNKLTVCDFASGTGDNAIIYAINKAIVKGCDFNENSIKISKKRAENLKLKNVKFIKADFFKIREKFDFVSSTAAIHHLKDPIKGIKHLKNRVKEDGFLFVSFGLRTSNLQHALMKIAVRKFGKKDQQIYKAAKKLFPNHIKRCVLYGLRKESNVIYDQFINPQHNYLNLNQVLKILGKNFILHSSWPKIFIPRGDSAMNDSLKNSSLNKFFLSEIYWSQKNQDDKVIIKNSRSPKYEKTFYILSNLLNNQNNFHNFMSSKFKKTYETIDLLTKQSIDTNYNLDKSFKLFVHEVKIFMKSIKDDNLSQMRNKIKSFNILFKGTSGLGLNYFIFKKIVR